ncbi:MAG: indolepyruvate oxidoreductase subunit beta [Bacillota bacterium]
MMKDFIIASVGGQGGLLATTVLASVFVAQGADVKTSEVHGMAQRGGTVTSYVRRGEKVYSPVVPKGEGDLILGLELLEAYRELPSLRSGGIVLTSDEAISPVPVNMGDAVYPELGTKSFLQRAGRAYLVPALTIARQAGNSRTSNIAMLGALSVLLDAAEDPPLEIWEAEVSRLVPKRTVEVNLTAFRAGREWMAKHR